MLFSTVFRLNVSYLNYPPMIILYLPHCINICQTCFFKVTFIFLDLQVFVYMSNILTFLELPIIGYIKYICLLIHCYFLILFCNIKNILLYLSKSIMPLYSLSLDGFDQLCCLILLLFIFAMF